jgi:hypothetical protein
VTCDSGPSRRTGFKDLAQALSYRATLVLLPAMRRAHAGGDRRIPGQALEAAQATGFGFQVVLGTLVNAILNDPEPPSIEDDEIIDRLGQCLFLLLLPADETPPASPGRTPRKTRPGGGFARPPAIPTDRRPVACAA